MALYDLNKHATNYADGSASITADGNADFQVMGFSQDKIRAQVTGGFGSGTITVQESLDGTNFQTCTDGAGANITFTAAGIKQVLSHDNGPIRILRFAMSGSTNPTITVTVLAGAV